MQIQAFHLKFTSTAESCNLFQALRNLSQVNDFNNMFSDEGWNIWPPMGVDALGEA